MAKVAVFDSGLGSLSVIRPIQRAVKTEIVYLADRKNFPYGSKSRKELEWIIRGRIHDLSERFNPSLIVVGSNTPTLLLPHLIRDNVVGVTPPLEEAARLSDTGKMAVLATRSVATSAELLHFIRSRNLPDHLSFSMIDASELVSLVESGAFVSNPQRCRKAIRRILGPIIPRDEIDTVTLSSTHLPFLRSHFEVEFPDVAFLDPGEEVARVVRERLGDSPGREGFEIFASSDLEEFQRRLAHIGIREKVHPFA